MRAQTPHQRWALLLLLAFAGLNLAGCSSGNQEQAEKGAIEQATDQAAAEAEKQIKTPMDKAKQTQELGDQRLEEMDKALGEQEDGKH